MLGSIMETYMTSSPLLPACRMSKSKSTHGEYLNAYLQACFSGVQGILQPLLPKIQEKSCTETHPNSGMHACHSRELLLHGFLMNEPSLDCRIQSVWLLLAANEVVPAQSSLHRKNSTDLQRHSELSNHRWKDWILGIRKADEENAFNVLSRCSCPWRNGFLTAAGTFLPAKV